jgi:hypothetical protein
LSGWYFTERSADKFVVGYLGNHPNGGEFTFSDRIRACAEFIIREVRWIAE